MECDAALRHRERMSKSRCYTPQLKRALVHALYQEAKARRVPMTTLANSLIKAALGHEGVLSRESQEMPGRRGAKLIR